jgi:radical SAM protein with 4Fe4S-binding SPASM domain
MYFKLNPECYLVAGTTRSTIHNLHTGGIIWLDEAQSAHILQSETGAALAETAEVHQSLSDKGWGFYSNEPVYVDKARPINVFREKKLWKEAPTFNMAILQIVNSCNQRCDGCGVSFCPICLVGDSAAATKPTLTTAEWVQVIKDVASAGAGSVLFTGGECMLHPDLHMFIMLAIQEGMSVAVQTNGLMPLDNLPESVSVSVRLNTIEDFDRIAANIANCTQVAFLCQDFSPELLEGKLRSGWTARQVMSDGPRISRPALSQCGLDRFFVKKNRDSCLNGKMFIRHDGSLVPCLEQRHNVIGNVSQGNFSDLYKTLINDYWCTPLVDQAEAGKCKQCEFIYACNACRFLNVEQRCSYDPSVGQWSPLDVLWGEES